MLDWIKKLFCYKGTYITPLQKCKSSRKKGRRKVNIVLTVIDTMLKNPKRFKLLTYEYRVESLSPMCPRTYYFYKIKDTSNGQLFYGEFSRDPFSCLGLNAITITSNISSIVGWEEKYCHKVILMYKERADRIAEYKIERKNRKLVKLYCGGLNYVRLD